MEIIEYTLFVMLSALARTLSFTGAGRIGSFLGTAVYRCTNFRKAITLDNLRNAFPEKSSAEIHAIARGAFRNYGIALVQMLWSWGADEAELRKTVRLKNPETITKALGQGKGVLVLSAHFGSWELLLSGFIVALGKPMTAIVQRQRNGRIDALIDRHRSRFGNTMVPMGPSVREILTALRLNKLVLLLGDQSGPKEAVFVPFFGRPAATHRGAALFSLKTGAPIVLLLLHRQADGTYEAVMDDVDLHGVSGSSEESVLELTRRHTAMLEARIRACPEQWLWMHKRWKHTEFFETHLVENPPHAPAHE